MRHLDRQLPVASCARGSSYSAICSSELDKIRADTHDSLIAGQQARRGDSCRGVGHCAPKAIPGGCCFCQTSAVLMPKQYMWCTAAAVPSPHVKWWPKCPGQLSSASTTVVRHTLCACLCRILSKPELDLWLGRKINFAFLSHCGCVHALHITLRAPRQTCYEGGARVTLCWNQSGHKGHAAANRTAWT